MKRRSSHPPAHEAVAILSLLAACTGQDEPGPMNPPGAFDAALGSSEAGALGGGFDAGSSGCTAGGTGGTAGGVGAPGAIPPTFETVKLVFGGGGGIMPCSAAPCHGVNGLAPPDHPLELPPDDDTLLYTNLLSYVSKACGNTKLVEPCNPARSALVTILKGACGNTPRMPYGCTAEAGDCIPDEYINAVAQWITNGAPRQ